LQNLFLYTSHWPALFQSHLLSSCSQEKTPWHSEQFGLLKSLMALQQLDPAAEGTATLPSCRTWTNRSCCHCPVRFGSPKHHHSTSTPHCTSLCCSASTTLCRTSSPHCPQRGTKMKMSLWKISEIKNFIFLL